MNITAYKQVEGTFQNLRKSFKEIFTKPCGSPKPESETAGEKCGDNPIKKNE